MKNEVFVPVKVDKKPKRHFKLPIRVAAFLFALIIAGSTCFFAVPVSAEEIIDDIDLNVVFKHEDMPDGEFICFSFDRNVPYGDYSFQCFVFGSDTVRPFDTLVSSEEDGEYILALYNSSTDDALIISSLSDMNQSNYIVFHRPSIPVFDFSRYGYFVYFKDFIFKEALSVEPILFSGIDSAGLFTSDGLYFDFVTSSGEGDELSLVYSYSSRIDSDTLVYANGEWLKQEYRYLYGDIVCFTRASLFSMILNSAPLPPSFLDRLGSGLTSVITWFGSVIASLVTGSLAPVFWFIAVTVGVSLLGFGFVWLRRFIFGW